MAYRYKIDLTRDEILTISNALNTEGKRFDRMATNSRLDLTSTTPKQTIAIWDNAAADHLALTSNIILQMQNIAKYGHGEAA